MSAVRWGIIGCGWVVRDYVAPAFADAENATVVALADPSEAALSAVGGILPEAKRYRSLEEAVSDANVDAVYVATPNHLHREAVIVAAGAGKHVLCEKPIAPTLTEAEEMLSACREAGVVYATAFDQRFHAAHLKLREMIENGVLGIVCSVRIRYACWLPPEWSPDGISQDNWRTDPIRAGGGAFVDLAPHGLDLAQYLLGEELTETHAIFQNRVFDYPVEDGATLIGRFVSGALLTHQVAYNTPDVLPRRELEVVGTEGMAIATNTMGQTPGGTLEFISAKTGERREVDVPGIERSPFLNQIEAFSKSLISTRDFGHPPERDLETMKILSEAVRRNAQETSPEREDV